MTICKVLSKTKTTQKPSYEDFEPYLKWYHEVDHETIDIDLRGTYIYITCMFYLYLFFIKKTKI